MNKYRYSTGTDLPKYGYRFASQSIKGLDLKEFDLVILETSLRFGPKNVE